MRAMAHYSPLRKIAMTNIAETENLDATYCPAETTHIVSEGEAPGVPNNDGRALSAGGTEDSIDGGASDDENSRTYYFGVSTITLGKINEMVEKGYFAEGEARAPRVEAVSEPDNDEAVMYEDFFIIGLCMHPHPTWGGILLHFQAQLH
jgi:hypothetical protein